MSRRRSQKSPPPPRRPGPFHAPFGDLARAIRKAPTASPAKPPAAARPPSERERQPAPAPKEAEEQEQDVFLREMADVRPLAAERRVDLPPPAIRDRRAPVSEEAEAMAALSDFVSGAGEFDLSDSTEYLEGCVVGLDARILRRLRRGEFAYQDHLDLHGMSAVAARGAVEQFITASLRAGHRCLLIVHGRGLNSKDGIPVLKERLKSWLASGRMRRTVLAFTSARPADGGVGAVYVLLRRRRGAKEPIAVYEGAKRE